MSIVLDPNTAAPPARRLVTIEEYEKLSDNGRITELVRGEVVELPFPRPRHGEVCSQAGYLFRGLADRTERGRVLLDAAVITRRSPDTLRGADVAFYSYARVPKGPLPNEYLTVAPEVEFEVKSPDDRWKDILEKIAEFLSAGVVAVCVLDPDDQTAYVYTADASPRTFTANQVLELPEPLTDFRVPVSRFFE